MNVPSAARERFSLSLSGTKRPRPGSGGSAVPRSDDRGRSPAPPSSASASPAPPQAPATAAARTPSALLSRDLAQLSSDLNTPLADIRQLRANVAAGVVNDAHAGHGGRAAEMMEGVMRHCMQNDSGGMDDEAGGRIIARPQPLMVGAVTSLDLCARALLLQNMHTRCDNNDNNRLDGIGTGNTAMDELLAPDQSYSAFGNGWNMPLPYKIPKPNEEPFVDGNGAAQHSQGGVPFGMVTELSGPPSSGKSQLSISIAAHATLRNNMRVHYISGGGSLKALSRRLFAMCLDLAKATTPSENEARAVALRALERVEVSSVADAYSMLAALARIDQEEDAHHIGDRGPDDSTGTLLVVDSVSGCLGHHLSGDKAGPALVSQVALTLRHMARTHDGRLSCNEAESAETCRPRRFAVVVTNGSVARRDNEPGSTNATTGRPASHKPAMGRYWHVGDVSLWLEEDGVGRTVPSLYDGPVRGLSVRDEKVVRATLTNHYGKSCKAGRAGDARGKGNLSAKFCITSAGVKNA